MSDELDAIRALCCVLLDCSCFNSCAELAEAVADACDECEASNETRALIENELGVAIRGALYTDDEDPAEKPN